MVHLIANLTEEPLSSRNNRNDDGDVGGTRDL